MLIAIIVFIFVIFLIEKVNFPSPQKNLKSTLLMMLKNFEKILSFIFIFLILTLLQGEEKIDIWKNKKGDNIEKINEDLRLKKI